MPSFLDMPTVAMNLILQKLDFRSIQCLRKSCRDLRNFIDDVKPALKLDVLDIQLYESFIRLALSDMDLMRYTLVQYQNEDAGRQCIVIEEKQESRSQKSLANSNYVDVSCNDIQSLLDLQTSGVLEKLRIDVWRPSQESLKFLDKFQEYLQSRNNSLNVSYIRSATINLKSIMHFLPFVSPRKLDSIDIRGHEQHSNQGFDFSELFELEQWKCAKEVIFHPFKVDNYLGNFLHFETATIKFNVLSMEVVLNLKETFFRSPHMDYFEIYFNTFNEQLSEMFGEPRYDNFELHWYFKVSNDADNLVTISLREYESCTLRRINRQYVPEGVVVH